MGKYRGSEKFSHPHKHNDKAKWSVCSVSRAFGLHVSDECFPFCRLFACALWAPAVIQAPTRQVTREEAGRAYRDAGCRGCCWGHVAGTSPSPGWPTALPGRQALAAAPEATCAAAPLCPCASAGPALVALLPMALLPAALLPRITEP